MKAEKIYHYPALKKPKTAIVLGGGIAGCSAAFALAKRGVQVTLYEKNDSIASEASANPHAITYPFFAKQKSPAFLFYGQCLQHTLALLKALDADFQQTGLLHIGKDEEDNLRLREMVAKLGVYEWLDEEAAGDKAGVSLPRGAVWVADACVVDMRSFCEALVANSNISVKTNAGWQGEDAEAVIYAHPVDQPQLDLKFFGGQVSHIAANTKSEGLKTVVCSQGYITPQTDRVHHVGASYEHRLEETEEGVKEAHARNLGHFEAIFGTAEAQSHWRGVRVTTPDRLPIMGLLPEWESINVNRDNPLKYSNLSILTGHGSRGLLSAPFGGEVLAALLCGEELPVDASLLKAIHPARFQIRSLKRQ